MSQHEQPVVDAADNETDADFDSGFTELPPATTATKPVEPVAEAATEAKVEPKPAEETAPKQEPKAETPSYAQITIDELEGLKAAASKTAENKKQLDTLLGTIGRVQQYLKRLDETAASGIAINLPADALADMQEDYPELAAKLQALFAKARVHGARLEEKSSESQPAQPSEADQKSVSALIREAMYESAKETLEDAFPDWRDIVGAVDEQGNYDPKHPFRQWLASKDEAYQHKINATNSPGVIARAIERFQKETAKPATKVEPKLAPQAAARRDRIEGAIQPKGDGGLPGTPTKSTEDDAFTEGFSSG